MFWPHEVAGAFSISSSGWTPWGAPFTTAKSRPSPAVACRETIRSGEIVRMHVSKKSMARRRTIRGGLGDGLQRQRDWVCMLVRLFLNHLECPVIAVIPGGLQWPIRSTSTRTFTKKNKPWATQVTDLPQTHYNHMIPEPLRNSRPPGHARTSWSSPARRMVVSRQDGSVWLAKFLSFEEWSGPRAW